MTMVQEAVISIPGGGMEIAPDALAGRTSTEPEIVRWVARNIDNPAVGPEDCPDPFAWTLLRQCRESPAFVGFFIEKLWAKLLPSRSQQEKADGDGQIDGTVTINLIERIRTIRDESKRGNIPGDSIPDLTAPRCGLPEHGA